MSTPPNGAGLATTLGDAHTVLEGLLSEPHAFGTAPEGMLQMWPVSRKVNSVGYGTNATLTAAIL